MSSRFANRRKPRKIGGSDEEDDGAAPGECASSTYFLLLRSLAFSANDVILQSQWSRDRQARNRSRNPNCACHLVPVKPR
jgi:hypothetical protein